MPEQVLKMDADKKRVWGWASVAVKSTGDVVIDLEEDVIPPDVLEEAAIQYVLDSREGSDRHAKDSIGKTATLITAIVTTKEMQKAMGLEDAPLPVGFFVGFQIEDEEVWEKVKKGEYRSFSIGGFATKTRKEV